MINKRQNILILCFETNNNICGEKIYFSKLQNSYRNKINYDIFITICPPFKSASSLNNRLKAISADKMKYVIFCRDNDIKNDTFNVNKWKKEVNNFFDIKKQRNKIQVLDICIPQKNISFDHFLLMHFNQDKFKKNCIKPKEFLKKEINENYKACKDSMDKILNQKDWINNLIENSSFDENYHEFIKLVYSNK